MDTTQAAPSRKGIVHLFNRIAPTYDVINRMLSFRREGGAALNRVLGNTGRALSLYSIVFSIGWIL